MGASFNCLSVFDTYFWGVGIYFAEDLGPAAESLLTEYGKPNIIRAMYRGVLGRVKKVSRVFGCRIRENLPSGGSK